MAEDRDESLGGGRTIQPQDKPTSDELDTRSLGDQATFGGRAPVGENSLGDQVTFSGGEAGGEILDDGIEVVDLSARYKIEKTLGKGGMGEVLLATDTRLERKVAIKRILGEAARSRTAINRFLTEAKSIAALNHPNIVQIYDYGRASDGPFLIMEFVDGESLLDRTRGGALPLEEAVELTCQLCDGLAVAHDAGIIHRDIKPANILVNRLGVPKLTDFGLAKTESADTGMTMAGAVLGTLDFMPPEQRRDAALTDARSDLWSLAATLYQLLTGESPRVIDLDALPSTVKTALAKGLKTKKEERYETAREFKQALKQALAAGTELTIETGDCPHCGAKNETSRKFCKKCAQSLEVGCLSCKSKMPMWEEVCGNCGAKQGSLVEQRKQEMAAGRVRAEQHLEEFEFAKAAALAKQLGEEPDLRLRQLRGWSEKFAIQVEAAQREQLARVGELISQGLKHEQAFDYQSALHALEQIPSPLLLSALSGQQDTAAEILERVREKQAECKRLEKVIKQRIESRQLNGLLKEVEQLLQLRPDKSDALKLRKQLQERESKLRQTRDEAFAAARQLTEGHDYEGALRELARIDYYVIEEPQQQLMGELQAKLDELQQLQERINSGLAIKEYAGLLELVGQFLELCPEEQSMRALREQLRAREAKNQAAVQSLVENAKALRNQGEFANAIDLLAKIPLESQSNTSHELLDECSELAELRHQAIERLQRGLANFKFRPALSGAGVYSDRIAEAGIADTEFSQLLKRCETGLVEHEQNEARRKKRNRQMLIGSVAASVLLLLGVVSYFVVSASMRAAAVKRALAAGDFEEVLRLDASNSEGLALKSKAEAVSRALATDNFEEVLRLDPHNREGLALKSKVEAEAQQRAEAISRALAAEDYEEVLRLDVSKLPTEAISKLPAEAILKLPQIKNSIGLELKLVPAGQFTMGSPVTEKERLNDETQHEVNLTRSFYIGVYEVTQEQFERVMRKNPSRFPGPKHPVETISWHEAVEFCHRLSNFPEERSAGRIYRLPTEAEWEYASRAGAKTRFSFGDDEKLIGEFGWVHGYSDRKSHPVGQKKPNAWGLYDMYGNVSEWCSDWYGKYPRGVMADPTGPRTGTARMLRGGGWLSGPANCRSAFRYKFLPSGKSGSDGMRVVMEQVSNDAHEAPDSID